MQSDRLLHLPLVVMTLLLGGCGMAANKQAAEATAAKLYQAWSQKD
jgi:outer membrane biogenesis lipoprotein LolB